MNLYGIYLSPYVRRVAISLTVSDIPFTHENVKVFETPDVVRTHNPMVRVPTLVLDDGDVLVESGVMLDEIDQMVGPDRALVPATGPMRRKVLQVAGYGVSVMEKSQWAFYETRFHPAEKIHEPWIKHNDDQAIAGIKHLDGIAATVGPGGWLAGTDSISQADITCAVAVRFVKAVRPEINFEDIAPALAAFAARCEELPAFKACPVG